MVARSPPLGSGACPRRDASCIAAAASNTANGLPGAVFDLFFFSHRRGRRAVGRILVLRPRKLAGSDLFGEALGRIPDLLGEVGVALHELRRLPTRETEHVVVHEHLPIRAGPAADADRRDPKGLRDLRAKLARNSLENNAE